MKKVYVSSDLHLDKNLSMEYIEEDVIAFAKVVSKELLDREATDFIIAGDIAKGRYLRDIFITTLKLEIRGYCKLHLVFGDSDICDEITLEEFKYDKLHEYYLPNNPIETEDKIIFGVNGFADESYSNSKYKAGNINKYIEKHFTEQFEATNSMLDGIINHQLEELQQQIDEYPDDKEKVVVMHFVPKKEFTIKDVEHIPQKDIGYLGSGKFGEFFEDNGISSCHFGHTHFRLSEELGNSFMNINGVQYYCSPTGEIADWTTEEVKDDEKLELLIRNWKETLVEM